MEGILAIAAVSLITQTVDQRKKGLKFVGYLAEVNKLYKLAF